MSALSVIVHDDTDKSNDTLGGSHKNKRTIKPVDVEKLTESIKKLSEQV